MKNQGLEPLTSDFSKPRQFFASGFFLWLPMGLYFDLRTCTKFFSLICGRARKREFFPESNPIV
mgnify:CR=1 FL=1